MKANSSIAVPGPISLSFYLSDGEADKLVNYVTESEVLSKRDNIMYHVVYSEGVRVKSLQIKKVLINLSGFTEPVSGELPQKRGNRSCSNTFCVSERYRLFTWSQAIQHLEETHTDFGRLSR
jgi:hypothetical protein